MASGGAGEGLEGGLRKALREFEKGFQGLEKGLKGLEGSYSLPYCIFPFSAFNVFSSLQVCKTHGRAG